MTVHSTKGRRNADAATTGVKKGGKPHNSSEIRLYQNEKDFTQ